MIACDGAKCPIHGSTFHVLVFLMSLRGHGFVHSFAKTP